MKTIILVFTVSTFLVSCSSSQKKAKVSPHRDWTEAPNSRVAFDRAK